MSGTKQRYSAHNSDTPLWTEHFHKARHFTRNKQSNQWHIKADTSHIADKRSHLLHSINRKWSLDVICVSSVSETRPDTHVYPVYLTVTRPPTYKFCIQCIWSEARYTVYLVYLVTRWPPSVYLTSRIIHCITTPITVFFPSRFRTRPTALWTHVLTHVFRVWVNTRMNTRVNTRLNTRVNTSEHVKRRFR